ncbi:hypothetical protein JOF46_000458 [Paeniglutamicibacter psychrophenolicus]|uniref:Uncharacterized protein n=1 Tax=Paeniglutamicibacter psychrophenolicus TaxID=257454 RepID=A0ABS4W8L6_9MICC|nr:hypothetical protein [Paeniglutamicibacter psychrophenolicus]
MPRLPRNTGNHLQVCDHRHIYIMRLMIFDFAQVYGG